MGKPGDELSNPEPSMVSRVLPWKIIETTLVQLAERNINFCFSIRIDFTGKSTFGMYTPSKKVKKPNFPKAAVELW